MNKRGFIKALSEKLNYNEETCIIIHDILEDNFFISRKSKEKITYELANKINVTEEEAEVIYETAKKILNEEIKNKMRHPFGRREE